MRSIFQDFALDDVEYLEMSEGSEMFVHLLASGFTVLLSHGIGMYNFLGLTMAANSHLGSHCLWLTPTVFLVVLLVAVSPVYIEF